MPSQAVRPTHYQTSVLSRNMTPQATHNNAPGMVIGAVV